jgi:hypothetical protein
VIGGSMIGAYEFWYVPASSPIKSLKAAIGKPVAYSTAGSSTNLVVLGFQELYGIARRTRDDFNRKQNALPDQISGLDAIMADAVTYKFIPAPLTANQVKTLIQLQAPIKQAISAARRAALVSPCGVGYIAADRRGDYALCGHGEVAEWSIAPHSKCGVRATVPGVRIPPSPPSCFALTRFAGLSSCLTLASVSAK